jgi:hypothetical protein
MEPLHEARLLSLNRSKDRCRTQSLAAFPLILPLKLDRTCPPGLSGRILAWCKSINPAPSADQGIGYLNLALRAYFALINR